MIKRKNGVKKTVAMVIVLVMLAITTLPAYATNNIIEVTGLENFIVQVKNPTNEEYIAKIKVYYYNDNEELIYQKEITQNLNALEQVEIDAKEYYNSSKTRIVKTEVSSACPVATLRKAKIAGTSNLLLLVMNIIFFVCASMPKTSQKKCARNIFLAGTTITAGLWIGTIGILMGLLLGTIK